MRERAKIKVEKTGLKTLFPLLAPNAERNPNVFSGKSRRRLLEKNSLGRGGNSFSPNPFSFPPRRSISPRRNFMPASLTQNNFLFQKNYFKSGKESMSTSFPSILKFFFFTQIKPLSRVITATSIPPPTPGISPGSILTPSEKR